MIAFLCSCDWQYGSRKGSANTVALPQFQAISSRALINGSTGPLQKIHCITTQNRQSFENRMEVVHYKKCNIVLNLILLNAVTAVLAKTNASGLTERNEPCEKLNCVFSPGSFKKIPR